MIEGRPIDMRVSTMPGKFGEKVVIRVIDNRNAIVSLEKLGFTPPMLAGWRKVVQQPNGVVLVTGPTGSGKSTTLYSVLNEISSESLNVSTVEDPVEAHSAESISRRSMKRPVSPLPGRCVRCFARILTSSWLAKFATKKPQ